MKKREGAYLKLLLCLLTFGSRFKHVVLATTSALLLLAATFAFPFLVATFALSLLAPSFALPLLLSCLKL
jgi:hypothetical protein